MQERISGVRIVGRNVIPNGVEIGSSLLEAVRSVDMASSNAWAEFAGVFCRTRSAFLEHESVRSLSLGNGDPIMAFR